MNKAVSSTRGKRIKGQEYPPELLASPDPPQFQTPPLSRFAVPRPPAQVQQPPQNLPPPPPPPEPQDQRPDPPQQPPNILISQIGNIIRIDIPVPQVHLTPGQALELAYVLTSRAHSILDPRPAQLPPPPDPPK